MGRKALAASLDQRRQETMRIMVLVKATKDSEAAKARFAPDSLLEERGFEPLILPGAVTLHMARLLDMPAA
jgi:hypothetical protein